MWSKSFPPVNRDKAAIVIPMQYRWSCILGGLLGGVLAGKQTMKDIAAWARSLPQEAIRTLGGRWRKGRYAMPAASCSRFSPPQPRSSTLSASGATATRPGETGPISSAASPPIRPTPDDSASSSARTGSSRPAATPSATSPTVKTAAVAEPDISQRSSPLPARSASPGPPTTACPTPWPTAPWSTTCVPSATCLASGSLRDQLHAAPRRQPRKAIMHPHTAARIDGCAPMSDMPSQQRKTDPYQLWPLVSSLRASRRMLTTQTGRAREEA